MAKRIKVTQHGGRTFAQWVLVGIAGIMVGWLPGHNIAAAPLLATLATADELLPVQRSITDFPKIAMATVKTVAGGNHAHPQQAPPPVASLANTLLLPDMPLPQGLLRDGPVAENSCSLQQVWAAAIILAGLSIWFLLQIHGTNRKLRHNIRQCEIAAAKFRGLVEQRLMGLFIIQDSRFVYINPKFAQMFGYTVEDIMGHIEPLDLIAAADQAQVHEYLCHPPVGSDCGIHQTFSAIRSDGSVFELGISGEARDYEGRPAILGVALDITEQNRIQRQLNYLAFYDPLTELPNRALFFDRLNQALAYHKRTGGSFALMVLDLDGFKRVNDSYGHPIGDMLLVAVGRQLRTCIREADTVARMGGDEFTILLQDIHQSDNVTLVASKILATLAEPVLLMEHTCHISASIGICIAPRDGHDMETLLSCADAAMYESKARGKNTYTFYRPTPMTDRPAKIPLLEWNEQLNLGVPLLDEQHIQMVALLNRIGAAIKEGNEEESIMALFEELAALTHVHFETEQQLMDELDYADNTAHRQEHRKLLEELRSIQRQFDSASPLLTLQTLKDWLRSHITHSDRALALTLLASDAGTDAAAPELPHHLPQT